MKALILAGGKGTRLKPFTLVLPKPLMPVGDYPILEIILRQLKSAGVDEVILAVGHMAQLFEAFFQDGRRIGIHISYSFEDQPLGTAGPIAAVIDRLGDDFIVMNGDLLTTLNYGRMFAYHREVGAAATIAMYRREIKLEFGVIESTAEGKLEGYREKPTQYFDFGMGVNIINREVVSKYIKKDEYLDIPDLMMRLKFEGNSVYCYREDCFWLDIGRPNDYEMATEIFEARKKEFLW
jgi:NDP-sugar pyrophosphorylase family protein